MDDKYFWITGVGTVAVLLMAIWFGTSSGQVWLSTIPNTNNTAQITTSDTSGEGAASAPPFCISGWKCQGITGLKGYQLSNCQWTNTSTCQYGCINGVCSTPTCTLGWKCQSNGVKGYQLSNCQWTNTSTCQYGCSSGACNTCGTVNNACCGETTCNGANLICTAGKCQKRFI